MTNINSCDIISPEFNSVLAEKSLSILESREEKKSPVRVPATKRGRQTFEAIVAAAVQLFRTKGYHAVSVSEICRTAEVANGSFYQYFPDKIDVFNEIVNRIIADFLASIDAASSLETVIDGFCDFFDAHGQAFQVFREAEFLEISHPLDSFYNLAVARLNKVLNTSEPVSWAIIGGISMVALFYGVWPGKPIAESVRRGLKDVVKNGIALRSDQDILNISLKSRLIEELDIHPDGRSEKTRAALIKAARESFSRIGYSKTHIAHITQMANTALGTFYIHFNEKRDILDHVTTDISTEMQRQVFLACQGLKERLEIEKQAFVTFLEYLMNHHEIYRIVREAEFAEPEVGHRYYKNIWNRWTELVEAAMKADQLRKTDPGVVAAFLMGSQSHAGLRWVLWEKSHIPPACAITATWRFICLGLLQMPLF